MNTRTKNVVSVVAAVCVAVMLALVVGDRRYETRMTYSEFLQQVQSGEVAKATVSVADSGANTVMYILKNGARMQTIVPRDYKDALTAMQSKLVNVEIRSTPSPQWRALENSTPFFLLLGFWAIMLRSLRNKPSLLG